MRDDARPRASPAAHSTRRLEAVSQTTTMQACQHRLNPGDRGSQGPQRRRKLDIVRERGKKSNHATHLAPRGSLRQPRSQIPRRSSGSATSTRARAPCASVMSSRLPGAAHQGRPDGRGGRAHSLHSTETACLSPQRNLPRTRRRAAGGRGCLRNHCSSAVIDFGRRGI